MTFETVAVHFGRLDIHPILEMLGGFSLGPVKAAFDKELKGVSRLSDVQIGDGFIQFTTKPAQ